jgi:16S rRNA (guanine527-N7)-methyltransferase
MVDPAAPPEGRSFDELITALVPELGDHRRLMLGAYRDALYQHNQHTNLTAVRDLPGIERRLIVESLRLVPTIRDLPRIDAIGRQSLIDIGTGGGLPGMVIAIACPELDVTLMDATGKKVAFLDTVIRNLSLSNAVTIHGRAEEIAREPKYRMQFDIGTARAVSSLPALLELGLPFLRTGGHLVLPKGTAIDDELTAAERAGAILGGSVLSTALLPDAGSSIETRLVIVRKTSTTPRTYPRRTGVPAKSPLGTEAPPPRSGR